MSRLHLTVPARVALMVLAVASPLALGGALPWWPPLALAIAAVVLTLAVAHRADLRIPAIALLPLAAVAVCLLQLVPLPPLLLKLASPEAASLREFALVPLGLDRWRPISLDPGATWAEVTKGLLYFATLLAAHQTARRTGAPWLIGTVAALGPGFVVIGALHALFGVDTVFGLYTFKESRPPLITPFGDANHLAGLLILSASACAGLVVESSQRSSRVFWAIAWFVSCVGVLLTGSRAGIAVFLGTQLLLVGWTALKLKGRKDARAWGRALTLTATVLVALGAGAYTLGDRLWARFSETHSAWLKAMVWPRVVELVRDYWRFGCGRGTFLLAFTRFNSENSTYTHPENIVLQWLSEFGLPLGLALLLAGAVLLWRLLRQPQWTLFELAPLVGVAGVALHNLADFSLEFPGVTVPLCVVLGACAAASKEDPFRLRRELILVPLVFLGALATWATGAGVRSSEERLDATLKQARLAAEVSAVARKAIDAHPADHLLYTYAAMAEVWLDKGDPRDGLAYANRALSLNPNDASAHQAAARALARLGRRDQALLEYRLAALCPTHPFPSEGVAYAKNLDELRQLAGPNPELLATISRAKRGEQAAQLMSEAAAMPDASVDRGIEAMVLWLDLGDVERATAILDDTARRFPASAQLSLARARLEQARHDESAAAKVLDEALNRWPGHFDLTVERVRLHLAQHQLVAAAELLQRASAVAVRPEQRLELSLLEGEVDVQLGRLGQAIEIYKRAVLRSPSTRTHAALASAYERTNRLDEAIAELQAAQHFATKEQQLALDEQIARLKANLEARRSHP